MGDNLGDEVYDLYRQRGQKVSDIPKSTSPDTPLPYKGMNVRAEIASRIFPAIYFEFAKQRGNIDHIGNQEDIARVVLAFTDALIKELNKK